MDKEKHERYLRVFSTRDGEAILSDLAKACYARRLTTVIDHQGRIDPGTMAFNEGRRSVYLYIKKAMEEPQERKVDHE